jgi:hypothetical protein
VCFGRAESIVTFQILWFENLPCEFPMDQTCLPGFCHPHHGCVMICEAAVQKQASYLV